MGKSSVADIVTGALDAQGAQILTVYSKVGDTYAVYATSERVMVQYSDDDKLGGEQRLALAPLAPLRGEINGLIDGWRQSSDRESQAKAKMFDRRVADALVVALQGDADHALDLMTAIKSDLVAERTSVARTQYLIAATIAAFVLVVIASVAAGPLLSIDKTFKLLWAGVSFGALGSLFSIALGIRDRSILTDLQARDNVVDAVSRIFVGAISAAVLLSLLKADLVQLGIGQKMFSADNPYMALVAAIIAGFSERLVGDMLGRAVLSVVGSGANPIAGTGSAVPAKSPSPTANEQNPLGVLKPGGGSPPVNGAAASTTDVPDDNTDDGCPSDGAIPPDQHTADVELPAASGGVETKAETNA